MYDCGYDRLTEMEFNARVDVTVDGQTDWLMAGWMKNGKWRKDMEVHSCLMQLNPIALRETKTQ